MTDAMSPPQNPPEADLNWRVQFDSSVFIQSDRLREAPTVKDLIRPLRPMSMRTTCLEVMEMFMNQPELYAMPVVDDEQKPVILLNRNSFIEFFAKPFSREIFGQRTIASVLQSGAYKDVEPIVVEESCSIEDVARIIIDAGMQHMVTGFVATLAGKYRGIANGHDLLNLITQRKQAELFYLAHYDHLTGIPNRMLLGDRLGRACLDAMRKDKFVALLFVDVDRFKAINDSLGHSSGDMVLRVLVGRLQEAARQSDTVARIGGDEFVILMGNLNAPGDAEQVAQRVLESMRMPVDVLGHRLFVTVSVGISIYPRDDTDISRLLAKADAAMYEAKIGGRNNFRTYTEGGAQFDPAKFILESDLRKAINGGELRLYFQPQINFESQQIQGVEALVRWQHPERGMIPPIEFIPLAEESGLIVPLGEWVLREGCRQLQAWHDEGLTHLKMSLNVSALQFHQQNFVDVLKSILSESGADPRYIELELTESLLMHNIEAVMVTLNEIRALGVSLAIDDFGTGFSSLNYLRRFPINRLKIDQSFIRDIDITSTNESITKAIIALANSLSLDVVAEGIEKPSEQSILENLGCPNGQGYLFSKPLSMVDVTDLIKRNRPSLPETACA